LSGSRRKVLAIKRASTLFYGRFVTHRYNWSLDSDNTRLPLRGVFCVPVSFDVIRP
jgi:hypothetical protein